MTPEGRVKAKVKKILKKYTERGAAIYSNWPVPAGYGESTLDCFGCIKGSFFAIETKAPGKKPTPRQRKVIEQMEAAGAEVFVIDGSSADLEGLEYWLTYKLGL